MRRRGIEAQAAYFTQVNHSLRSKTITGFGPWRSAVSADADHPGRDADVGLVGRGVGRKAVEGGTGESEPVGVVEQPVEDGIAKRGVTPRWTPKSGHQWTPENRPPRLAS